MKNFISISFEFDFKSQKFAPSMVVELNEHIQAQRDYYSLYTLLAYGNNIDLYSYEYEAAGLAESFLKDAKFDFIAFEQALRDESISDLISKIASDHLSVDDLSSQPNLKAALLEAYKLGQES